MVNKKQLFSGFIVILILFFGLKISEDYGISVDEDARRKGGQSFIKYIAEAIGVDNPSFKYIPEVQETTSGWMAPYGMVFEFATIIIEEMLGLEDEGAVLLLRHKINFIFYFIGVIFFFLLGKEIFGNDYIALLGTFIFILHPRIFGNSFYNPKDIIFLSSISISTYCSIKFIKVQNLIWCIIAAISIGLAISIRPFGLYLIFLLLLFYIFEKFIFSSFNKNDFIDILVKSTVLIILPFITLIILTPYYWEDTIGRFTEIYYITKNYPWPGTNFYFGTSILASEIPWHYIPIWISITTPITFQLLFIIGVLFFLNKTIYNYLHNRIIFYCFIYLIIPIFFAIILKSSAYDGWRHFYFIHVFSSIIITYGLMKLITSIKKIRYYQSNKIFIIILVFFAPVLSIIQLHPYQSVYFNILAGKDPMLNFEGDYWGTSNRKGLEWVVNNEDSDTIRVWVANYPGKINLNLLTPKQLKRIHIINDRPSNIITINQNKSRADYFITNYRSDPSYYKEAIMDRPPFNNEVFSINKHGMKILGVYKL